jgi:hypothetical protein
VWSLELHAEAVTPGAAQDAVPLLALQRAAFPIPTPFQGALLLDPASVLLLPPIALVHGSGSLPLSIPATPAFVGIVIHAQPLFLEGAAFGGWGFGNAIAEAIVE